MSLSPALLRPPPPSVFLDPPPNVRMMSRQSQAVAARRHRAARRPSDRPLRDKRRRKANNGGSEGPSKRAKDERGAERPFYVEGKCPKAIIEEEEEGRAERTSCFFVVPTNEREAGQSRVTERAARREVK